MIMQGDKKGMVALILKKINGEKDEMKQSPVNEAGDEMDQSMGFDSAVEEMFSAVEKKDISAFREALKSFIEMAMNECPMEEKE